MADLARIAALLGDAKYMRLDQAQRMELLAIKLRPRRILEIGTFHGAGACYLGAIAGDYGGEVWTVDLPWSADRERMDPQVEELLNLCGLSNVTVVRRGDGAEGWLRDFFQARNPPLDLVYLDGGHDWKSTAAQFALSWAALRIGGWVVMDDVANEKYPDVGAVFETVVPTIAGLQYKRGNWGFAMKLPPREYRPS